MLNSLKNLQNSEGLRSTALTTLGNIVSTTLGAIAFILLSRLLSPSEFGIFSAVFSLMLMVSKLGDLGTNIAFQRTLAQPEVARESLAKQEVISVGLYLKLALSIICLSLGLFLAPYLTIWLHLPLPIYVSLAWASMLGIIFFDYYSIVVQAAGRFGLSVFGSSLQSLLKILAIILLYYFHSLNVLALILVYGLTPFIAAMVMAIFSHSFPTWLSVSRLRFRLAPILALTQWTLVATLSASLSDNIDVLLVQSLLSSEQTGWYAAAFRIASFAAVAGYSIGVVLNVRVAGYKTKFHLDRYLQKAILLALITFVGMLVISLLSPLLIIYTAGAAYLPAVPVLRLLLYSTGFLMATSPFVSLFYTLNAPHYFAYSGILTALALIFFDYLWLPSLGIIGAGYAKLITRLLVFLYTLYAAKAAYHAQYGKK